MKLLIVLLVFTNFSIQASDDEIPGVPVRVKQVKAGNFKDYGEYIGTVKGLHDVTLIAYSGGKASKIKVKEGDYVKAGEALCDIDAKKSDLIHQSALLSQKLARENKERSETHLKNGSVSRQQYDQTVLRYIQSQTAVIDTKRSLEGARCISPISGVVTQIHINQYEVLPPGRPTISISQLDQIKVLVPIPDSDHFNFTGNPVMIQFDEISPQIPGKVYSGSKRIDQRDRKFYVEVRAKNPKLMLKPGMTVNVKVLKRMLKRKIVIPTSSILILTEALAVMVAEGDVAKKKYIKVLTTDNTKSVVAEGLSLGDRLIVEGQHQVVQDSPIKVVSEN